MSDEVAVMLRIAVFGLVAAIIYWFVSYEPFGTVALLLLGGGTGFAAVYMLLQHRREQGPREQLGDTVRRFAGLPRRDPRGPDDYSAENVAVLPLPSIWPLTMALGVAMLTTGLIYGLWLLVLGGMFVGVVLFFPDGVVGTAQKLIARVSPRQRTASPVTEVLAGIVGAEASPSTTTGLFIFLTLLIMGSFACLQTFADAITHRQYKFLVQMIVIEVFVMTFEVMFLYRELVDAITPWIAQQTGERFQPGLVFTLTLATFGWVGVRGMTWFLFGQYGTPPLLAFISRQPLVKPEAEGAALAPAAQKPAWWQAPVEDFKREVGWLHEKGDELMEYLMLPVLHVAAAALNFAMILVAARPVFSIPFKSLKEVLEARELLPTMRWQPKKVAS